MKKKDKKKLPKWAKFLMGVGIPIILFVLITGGVFAYVSIKNNISVPTAEYIFTQEDMEIDRFQGYQKGTRVKRYKSGKEVISRDANEETLYPKDDGYYDFKTGKVKGYDPSRTHTVNEQDPDLKGVDINSSQPQDYNKYWKFSINLNQHN